MKAFTLLELLIVIVTLIIIVGVINNVYLVGFEIWNEGYTRSDIRSDLSQALELMSKNLRQAESIDTLTESSVTFTADLGSGLDTYRMYLYHPSDPEPNPPYTQDTYALRWTQGSVNYGDGASLATDISAPGQAPFTQTGNTVTMDFTAARDDALLRMRSKVRPRNL